MPIAKKHINSQLKNFKDKKRRANYKYYTDQVWGLAQNYHLCLNSGEIGIDKCTELIVDLVK